MDIVWLRDDFRLDDQPALAAAANRPALYLYVHDQSERNGRPLGGAAKWRLNQALKAMERRLSQSGARLDIVAGPTEETLLAVARTAGASRVLWTRRYEGAAIALDAAAKSALRQQSVETLSFNGRLIREPWEFDRGDGRLPRTFSAFWRRHQTVSDMPTPSPAPPRLVDAHWPDGAPERTSIEALRLTPTRPDWSRELAFGETPGEEGALAALRRFAGEGLGGYASDRDLASRETSRLSAHLRFGEVSAIRTANVGAHALGHPRLRRDAEKFLSELGWRDFAALLLYANPDLATRPLKREFERFPFREDEAGFRAWTRGETGYPIVDAGMRQLWRTGYLHNRVRLVAASFLVKHLIVDWRRGEQWFWDTLCDADPASNPMNWQWVAGAGADAAPFFRIFNPVLQAQKFDPDGLYVRRWIPELARLAPPHLHAPWRAPEAALARAGIVLGKTYPKPIVDHAAARARALAAFDQIRVESVDN